MAFTYGPTPASPRKVPATPTPTVAGYSVSHCGRYWSVTDPTGQLVCLTVYRKGACEVVRRLSAHQEEQLSPPVGRRPPTGRPRTALARATC